MVIGTGAVEIRWRGTLFFSYGKWKLISPLEMVVDGMGVTKICVCLRFFVFFLCFFCFFVFCSVFLCFFCFFYVFSMFFGVFFDVLSDPPKPSTTKSRGGN